MSRVAVILGLYVAMTLLSVLVHLWVVYVGWQADGALWGLGYLVLFVYAEFYWAYRSFAEAGLSVFTVATAVVGLWWIAVLLLRKPIMRLIAADEKTA